MGGPRPEATVVQRALVDGTPQSRATAVTAFTNRQAGAPSQRDPQCPTCLDRAAYAVLVEPVPPVGAAEPGAPGAVDLPVTPLGA